MGLPDFDYYRAGSTSEAVEILTAHKGEAKILAGGTDLLWQLKHGRSWGKPCPRHLVSLHGITSLKHLLPQNGNVSIGAKTTHREIELSPLVKSKFSALHDACSQIGSVQIRNVATVVGNICNAAPSADTAAPLLALGAIAKVMGPQGKRAIALKDLYVGPGELVLEPDEMLLEIEMPHPPALAASAYLKLARRKAMDIAMIGIAAYLQCTPDKSRVEEARIALTTVAPTPIRAYEAEGVLNGARVTEDTIQDAANLAAKHASPRTSFRSTSEYRREMIRVFVRRTLKRVMERIQPESK
jgi:carbon-monoxide dehydrogenase medium subunit